MYNVSLEKLSKNWLELTTEYKPSAFWFWNAAMDYESIDMTISEMSKNGIRKFIIHPIHGLGIQYLSATYFDRCRHALNVAKKHNLKVWIYDEYGWPTGNAGGLLLEKYPQHKSWFLKFLKTADGQVLAEPFLSDRILDNVVGASWTKSHPGYLNTLSKDAVRCFIDLTHERYFQECKDYFGDVIVGFFTDEPVTMTGCVENQNEIWNTVGLPWTPELPILFKQEFKYDIESRYSELACDNESQIKQDYMRLIEKLHYQAYHRQIADWCSEHGVLYSGHIGENVPLMQSRFSCGSLCSLGSMHEPGVDLLGCKPYPEHRFLEQVQVSSVARHIRSKRVCCEAFGIAPFSIRLGQMLRSCEMLGLHGIDDIALMGFHQSLDGVRKRMYWPPLFNTAPWWQAFPEFGDSVARCVGLASLGHPKHRYAILFPDYHLTQTNPFLELWSKDEPVFKTLSEIGLAIYKAGETFEFIFESMLPNVSVENGMLILENETYSEIIVPSDLRYPAGVASELKRLNDLGGTILNAPASAVIENCYKTSPSWKELLNIISDTDYRLYRFEFEDGNLFALRNVSESASHIAVSSNMNLCRWDQCAGECLRSDNLIETELEPNSTVFFSATAKPFGRTENKFINKRALDSKWMVSTDHLNTARLTQVQFYHEDAGWLEPEYLTPITTQNPTGFIPSIFRGQTLIKMRSHFRCDHVPRDLGILYEQMHVSDINVNGIHLDISESQAMPVWDNKCNYIKISNACQPGLNQMEVCLKFEEFETSLYSHGFFRNRPVMPSCDIFLAGSFTFIDNQISVRNTEEVLSPPLDLSSSGWPQYSGRLRLSTRIFVDDNFAKRIWGIEIIPIAEDAIELIWNGSSQGHRIVFPYRFRINPVNTGNNKIEIIIAGTSGNLLADESQWGIKSINWLFK